MTSALFHIIQVSEWKAYLPKFVEIQLTHIRYTKLRSFPAILRKHYFNEIQNPHDSAYSELFLFTNWRSELELFEHDLCQCLQKHSELADGDTEIYETKVERIKKELFPN